MFELGVGVVELALLERGLENSGLLLRDVGLDALLGGVEVSDVAAATFAESAPSLVRQVEDATQQSWIMELGLTSPDAWK